MSIVLEEQSPTTLDEDRGPEGPPGLIRVLHLINGQHFSGAERVQDLLAARLGDYGVEVSFACLKTGCFARMRESRTAELFDVSMRSRVDVLTALRIARLIRKHRFAIVHTHTPRSALVGSVASYLTGAPLVHHLHSPTASDSTRRVRDRVNALIERGCMARATRVIAVSGALADYATNRSISESRLRVIHNGVAGAESLPRRSRPGGLWTIGAVALFRPRKGLEVLLEALAKVRDQGLPVRLLAVGPFETPQYEQDIRRRARELALESHIEWHGFTRDVRGQLHRMDLFVLPSLFGEGLPMVLLEAMGFGVPVIATRIDGVTEAVRDGVDGLLSAPGDAGQLASSIAKVLRGEVDWSQLRESAFERQRAHFSDRNMAQSVAEVYREILQEHE